MCSAVTYTVSVGNKSLFPYIRECFFGSGKAACVSLVLCLLLAPVILPTSGPLGDVWVDEDDSESLLVKIAVCCLSSLM